MHSINIYILEGNLTEQCQKSFNIVEKFPKSNKEKFFSQTSKTNIQNFDVSLNKYQTILSKLKEDDNLKDQQNTKYQGKLNENDLKSSIFSSLNTKNHEKTEQDSFEIEKSLNENSFKQDLSIRLNLLDERKKRLFEQKLNEEISNEFSDDSEKKLNPDFIHIQDFINENKKPNEFFNAKNLNEEFKRITPSAELDILDVITDQETINFLKKLMKIYENEDFLILENFFRELFQEINFSLDSDEEQELFLALQDRLTTNNASTISLNALKIFTSEHSLKTSVLKLLGEVKKSVKIKNSEEINKFALEEINIIKNLLDKKNLDLNDKQRKLTEFEYELFQREKKLAGNIEEFYRMCENRLESFFKEHFSQINKK